MSYHVLRNTYINLPPLNEGEDGLYIMCASVETQGTLFVYDYNANINM